MATGPFADHEDLLGLLASNLYTPLVWCYDLSSLLPLPPAGSTASSSSDAVVAHTITRLSKALHVLSILCPYLAGRVCEGGLVRHTRVIPLMVNDVRYEEEGEGEREGDAEPTTARRLPSFDQLKAKGFPVQMLDGEALLHQLSGLPSIRQAPTVAATADGSTTAAPTTPTPRPVLIVQANFLKGNGLLLCIAGEHAVMDGGGMTSVLNAFEAICGEVAKASSSYSSSSAAEAIAAAMRDDPCVKAVNMSRRDIIEPFPPNGEDGNGGPLCFGDELYNLTPPTNGRRAGGTIADNTDTDCDGDAPSIPPPQGAAEWNIFHFSAESQRLIKEMVMNALQKEGTDGGAAPPLFVSTNDALTAFIWSGIMRARAERPHQHRGATCSSSGAVSTFGRAVDIRAAMHLPMTYPGNMSLHTYTQVGLDVLLGRGNRRAVDENEEGGGAMKGVAKAALSLRKDLSEGTTTLLPLQARSLTTLLLQYKARYFGNRGGEADSSLASSPSKSPSSSSSPPPPFGIYPGARLKCNTNDVIMSSWAAMPSYGYSFGMTSVNGSSPLKPLAVRRPLFMAIEGLLYLMPANTNPLQADDNVVGVVGEGRSVLGGNGSIDAMLCLSSDDVRYLREDSLFSRFGVWVG